MVPSDQARSSRAASPILGTYRIDGSTLRFVARHPLDQPVYRALIDAALLHVADRRRLAGKPPTGTLSIDLELEEPRLADRNATVATSIYPSAQVLPENLLRFYIHFSAPMSRGEAYRHIHLLDAVDKSVPDPFLELEVGPVLEQGRAYTLVIDRDWLDARGRPLGSEYRRQFRVGPADQTSPEPRTWTIRAPEAGTRGPLEIRFPEPLDSALARRLITVEDGQRRIVSGQVDLAAAESRWLLTPLERWRAGEYRLVIGAELEDLAGNAVNRPFEVDQFEQVSRQIEARQITLPFQVRPLPR
jgi:hypothetical protein